ncbi:MFS transporter [Candidatus Lokiarchaeum ossiferum]|uniref:MFS transporter n=1 Tax=Candidatus Lokiarchaeum ossiferum TaxID=2951803 RepID=UPI00352CBC35
MRFKNPYPFKPSKIHLFVEKVVKKKTTNQSINYGSLRTRAIIGLYIAVFICSFAGMINDVIMARFLPVEFSSDSAVFGMTFTMFSLGKLIMMVPLAKISDKFGRKSLLIFAFGIYSVGTFLAGVAQSIEQFLFFRFLKGMSSFEGIALALINDYFKEGERGKPIAFLFTSLGIGSLLGTLTGGFFLNWFEFRYAFYILGLITFVSVLSVLVLIKNPKKINERNLNSTKTQRNFNKSKLKLLLQNKNFILGILIGTIITFIYSGLSSYTLFILLNYFEVENQQSGIFLLPATGAYILFSLTWGHNEKTIKILKRGLPILAIFFSFFIVLRIFIQVYIFILLLVLCFASLGVLMPAIDNFESNLVPHNIKGEALGLYRSITLIGSVIGSTIIGYIGSIFWEFAPFLLMGIFSLLGFITTILIKTSAPSPVSNS